MQTPLNAAPLFYALRTHLSARLSALAGSPPPPDVCTPVSTCSTDGAARAGTVSRRSGVIQCLNVVLQRQLGQGARRAGASRREACRRVCLYMSVRIVFVIHPFVLEPLALSPQSSPTQPPSFQRTSASLHPLAHIWN